MVGRTSLHAALLECEPHNPEFPRLYALWALETQAALAETIAVTKKIIASTKALMARADQLLDRR